MRYRVGSLCGSVALIICFLWMVTMKDVHAYIDLGSGSFLFQMLLASLFSSLFVLKVFWRRITQGITKVLSTIKGQSDTQTPRR